MELSKKFWQNLREVCGCSSGKVLIALSGGPDSVALLHLLLENPHGLALEPLIGHVNHQLRPAAAADAQFCLELAAKLKVPYVSRTVDVEKLAAQPGVSVEMAARTLRYQALHELATQYRCSAILLGHTADDQAETVLHNMARGTGVRGLSGMPFRHGLLVRPLLNVPKIMLLHYLDTKKLRYRIDQSNRDLSFRRNRIRHTVLPHLRENLNPEISEALCRLALNAAEAEAFIESMAQSAQKNVCISQKSHKIILDIDRISGYFPILRKYIIRNNLEALSKQKVRPDFDVLQRAEVLIQDRKIGKRTTLSGQWELLIDHDGIVIWNGETRSFDIACQDNEKVHLPEQHTFRYSLLSALPSPNSLTSHGNDIQYIDASKIKGKIWIRSAQKGDRFQPLGLKGSKLVSDLFNDRKVPLHKRSEIPIVACAAGIIWVVGLQLDERFKVTNQTKSILHMEFEEAAQ